jgi:hypothetical protein
LDRYIIQSVFEPIIEKRGGINRACKYIAKELKHRWTWKYIYHIYRGTHVPSKALISKLNAFQYPPRPRYRLKIEAQTKEQFEAWKKVPMIDRIRMMDELSGYKGE